MLKRCNRLLLFRLEMYLSEVHMLEVAESCLAICVVLGAIVVVISTMVVRKEALLQIFP